MKYELITQEELFRTAPREFALPALLHDPLEDAYDELELLGFPVSCTHFDMLQTGYRGGILARDLLDNTGRTVRMLGNLVTRKYVTTVRRELMIFGTFFDREGKFFDTTHFPPSLKKNPFTGYSVYLLEGKVAEEFGFAMLEVERMARLPARPDPRFR